MKMLLSEAIRIGSRMHQPCEEGWNDIGPDGEVRTCPITAASEAYGLLAVQGTAIVQGPKWIEPSVALAFDRSGIKATPFSRMPDEWLPITMFEDTPPCACGEYGVPAEIFDIIPHLYDVHRWSREEVADWVEKMEMKVDEKQWIAAKGPDKPWTPGLEW